jgi:hypothetical protein
MRSGINYAGPHPSPFLPLSHEGTLRLLTILLPVIIYMNVISVELIQIAHVVVDIIRTRRWTWSLGSLFLFDSNPCTEEKRYLCCRYSFIPQQAELLGVTERTTRQQWDVLILHRNICADFCRKMLLLIEWMFSSRGLMYKSGSVESSFWKLWIEMWIAYFEVFV